MMTLTESDSATRFMARSCRMPTGLLRPMSPEETMRYHHDKHYVGYVNRLNELLLDTPFEGQPLEDILLSADGALYNNAAQVWNHELFFRTTLSATRADAIPRTAGGDRSGFRVAGQPQGADEPGGGRAFRLGVGVAGLRQGRGVCRSSVNRMPGIRSGKG